MLTFDVSAQDYDCFYASVFENENPALRSLPLAVQQKQIVVTCNYEARRRGLYKLQLIKEARQVCPDVVIVLGEDLTRFRNASKDLYAFLKAYSWNQKVERLGFDEVFMDVSDIIDYNIGLLNRNDLINSYFCLSKDDPAVGFAYDASTIAGCSYPEVLNDTNTSDIILSNRHVGGILWLGNEITVPSLCLDQCVLIGHVDAPIDDALQLRLRLGSHLAKHLRGALHSQKGYTCTVGISTNKILSKLVGNLHKPCDQTTLLPPYTSENDNIPDNVTAFVDGHEVGKIPGIGFKLAQALRAHVLQRAPEFDKGLVYGGTKENVTVKDVRTYPGISAEALERILGGPGRPHGVGSRIWDLLNGCDDSEVGQARGVPTQISLEDSYVRLDTMSEVIKELSALAESLIRRMHIDLLEDDDSPSTDAVAAIANKRWVAFPKTIRLTTRARPPQNPDGSRSRSFARVSRSGPMPSFIFSLKDSIDSLVERLVTETLVPLFRKLHPEKSGWNLSLVNIAAANMVGSSSDKGGVGRDIAKMFARQDDVLREFKVQEEPADVVMGDGEADDDPATYDTLSKTQEPDHKLGQVSALPADVHSNERRISVGEREVAQGGDTLLARTAAGPPHQQFGSEDIPTRSQEGSVWNEDTWESEEDIGDEDTFKCDICSAIMPIFAVAAHNRWHAQF